MSVGVLKAHASNKLPSEVYDAHCGKIFITRPHNTVVLRCALCETETHTCGDFLAHILTHYPIKAEVDEFLEATQVQTDNTMTGQVTESVNVEEAHKRMNPLAKQECDELLEPMVDIKTLHKAPNLDIWPEKRTLEESLPENLPLAKFESRREDDSECVTTATCKTDNNNKPNYECKTCGVQLLTKADLDEHISCHTGQKPFPCDDCNKTFYTHDELMSHKRPFICKYCGMRFTTSGWRLRHEKGHELRDSNNRPYQCEKCDKSFLDAEDLGRHVMLHTCKRNHLCEICGAAFIRRRNLLQHMKTHDRVTTEKPVHNPTILVPTLQTLNDANSHFYVDMP